MTTIAVGALACVLPVQAGEIYRWQDENGNPVVSDRPPVGDIPYTKLNGARYGVSKSKGPAMASGERGQQDASSGVTPVVNASDRVIVEKRPELCAQAKDNIFKLETFPRIRVTDDDGTVRFMSDEEREEQLATAREVAAANCD